MSEIYNNAVFWIEVDKIKPNPFQPRREFDEARLRDLADSIRQYGVLQPLVVTRKEVEREDGGLATEYELIAGERRLRASRLAGIAMVPAVIRSGEDTDKMKLEMAIIENLQREDLNPVDRAQAFHQLINEFQLKHVEVAKKIGKSREYVSNTIRILVLPQAMLDALVAGQITEGHTRPLLMLMDRPGEQETLFRDIMSRRITVRDAENIARRIAFEKMRKKERFIEPQIIELEQALSERLGTRVMVEKNPRTENGKITIDFFDREGMIKILTELSAERGASDQAPSPTDLVEEDVQAAPSQADDDLYSVRNFSL
ncbi:MAG: hypothetical protein A2114_00020 [Candidatus Vogelbacteria bacterium GWA1_51_14]|uniref:ParB-like N-terminal domain-containing protein n=1 Tax=Candidatus Vogelbacteria bacterium GWA1_51_14 TaxID=1802435 RepID=A0A1G2Q9H0_9BACT|nr:MAG: hypothetical protein A2114_00020 [Candidatus Vogelbacteria bacterium GWA1_51_14]